MVGYFLSRRIAAPFVGLTLLALATTLLVIFPSGAASGRGRGGGKTSKSGTETASAKRRDEVRSLATELARMRVAVEALSNEVEAEKASLKSKVESLARQRGELEMMVRRERIRVNGLKKRIRQRRREVEKKAQAQESLRPVVRYGAKKLKQAVRRSLPFKRRERLAEIQRIVDSMKRKLVSPTEAVARLWARVEDELRLARENGIYSQVIEVNGREQLVEVARLGMVLFYFRTKGGSYGMATRRRDSWSFGFLKDHKKKKMVEHLFEALKKQIRTGFFTLPNGLPLLVREKSEEGRS